MRNLTLFKSKITSDGGGIPVVQYGFAEGRSPMFATTRDEALKILYGEGGASVVRPKTTAQRKLDILLSNVRKAMADFEKAQRISNELAARVWVGDPSRGVYRLGADTDDVARWHANDAACEIALSNIEMIKSAMVQLAPDLPGEMVAAQTLYAQARASRKGRHPSMSKSSKAVVLAKLLAGGAAAESNTKLARDLEREGYNELLRMPEYVRGLEVRDTVTNFEKATDFRVKMRPLWKSTEDDGGEDSGDDLPLLDEAHAEHPATENQVHKSSFRDPLDMPITPSGTPDWHSLPKGAYARIVINSPNSPLHGRPCIIKKQMDGTIVLATRDSDDSEPLGGAPRSFPEQKTAKSEKPAPPGRS